jgi:hypothetical protein
MTFRHVLTYLKCLKSLVYGLLLKPTKKEKKSQFRFWLKKTCVHGPKSFLHWLGCEWPVSLLAWFSLAKWCCIALFSRLLVWIYRPTLTPSFYALIHPGKPAQACLAWIGFAPGQRTARRSTVQRLLLDYSVSTQLG